MRLNKYIAHYYGVSRREADNLISDNKVKVNGEVSILGAQVDDNSLVEVKGYDKPKNTNYVYLLANKPVGYVCSRKSQDDSPTIYELLSERYQNLKTVGRLDKDSSGLIMFTNDGDFAQNMTHPSKQKRKIYILTLDRLLSDKDLQQINSGVKLKDGLSRLACTQLGDLKYRVVMNEGRNRQIRRTFGELGYTIIKLKRVQFGDHELGDLSEGSFEEISLAQ